MLFEAINVSRGVRLKGDGSDFEDAVIRSGLVAASHPVALCSADVSVITDLPNLVEQTVAQHFPH